MTYNANGGYFDSTSSTTTKEEKVQAQPSYRLNTTDEFKPTRDQVGGKDVAFVGWSETQHSDIYGLDDSYDDSILAATVDVSSENKTVYAVWGYDTNGDGKPDVQDESYGITASVDGVQRLHHAPDPLCARRGKRRIYHQARGKLRPGHRQN